MRSHCHILCNIKQVQANQLLSAPPLKPSENLWFPDKSKECTSQMIHSDARIGESFLTYQGWKTTLISSSKRKNVLEWKHALLPLWLLPLWQEILMMFLSVPQPLKLLANIFLSHRYIYLVTCRLQCTWTPYYKIKKEKDITKKNDVLFLRK